VSIALPPSRGLRWWIAVLLVVVCTLLLAAADRTLGEVYARFAVPTGAAQWIWEIRDRKDVSPAAFYAARDFTLDTLPRRARLLVSGDEEYILYLNGERVGAGSWRTGSPLDVWEVGPLLQPGANRLLAEVRSARGIGGLLLSLEDGDGRQLARTDESWRIFHRHELGLLRGWLPLTGDSAPPSTPASCWGYPPLGRWGSPRSGPLLPLWSALGRGRPQPAASPLLLPPLAHFPPDRPQPPRRLFDFGREVTGYLLVDVRPAAEIAAGLVWVGTAPPDPLAQPETAGMLVLPGRRSWMDARPRRFRYALIVGLPAATGTRVQEVDAVKAAGLLAPAVPVEARGVLGIDPPPLRTPVEDEVWRELEGVPGVAGRKKR
jgi:hypothetical protein